MNLDEYISDLLYKYDCVIVPELGGFVTNYRPARLDRGSNIFSPPSKSLSFNGFLVNNDGLLAKHIADQDALSFSEVNGLIKEKVEDYFHKLNNGDRVVFDKIGILYMDRAKKIQFSPDESVNYLLDSYALKRVFVHPVEEKQNKSNIIKLKPVIAPKITKEKIQPVSVPVAVPIQDNRNRSIEEEAEVIDIALNRRKWKVAAVLLPLIGILAYFMSQDGKTHRDYNFSNLNLFSDSTVQTYHESAQKVKTLDFDTSSDFPDLFELPEDQHTILLSLSDDYENTVAVRIKEKPITVKPTEVKESLTVNSNSYMAPPSVTNLRYHIIGGCFGVKKNAEKKVRRMRKRGYDAFIIDKRGGLWRVAYGSYASRNTALISLQAIKQNEDEKSWLLKK